MEGKESKEEPPTKRAKSAAEGEVVIHPPAEHLSWHNLGLTHLTFSDYEKVKYVCLMGTPARAKEFSGRVGKLLSVTPLAVNNAERYAVFLTGPVLTASHGVGNPSLSVLLHDLAKLLRYSGAKASFIRLGTCGGVGVPAGTVVVSTKVVNEYGESVLDVPSCGESHKRPTLVCQELTQALVAASLPSEDSTETFNVTTGTTMCCNGFYEEQGRMDGAICEITKEKQQAYLRSLFDQGVRNIEMESTALTAFCHHLGIPCAVVCTVLLNRLEGDEVSDKFNSNPTGDCQQLVLRLIQNKLRAEQA